MEEFSFEQRIQKLWNQLKWQSICDLIPHFEGFRYSKQKPKDFDCDNQSDAMIASNEECSGHAFSSDSTRFKSRWWWWWVVCARDRLIILTKDVGNICLIIRSSPSQVWWFQFEGCGRIDDLLFFWQELSPLFVANRKKKIKAGPLF